MTTAEKTKARAKELLTQFIGGEPVDAIRRLCERCAHAEVQVGELLEQKPLTPRAQTAAHVGPLPQGERGTAAKE